MTARRPGLAESGARACRAIRTTAAGVVPVLLIAVLAVLAAGFALLATGRADAEPVNTAARLAVSPAPTAEPSPAAAIGPGAASGQTASAGPPAGVHPSMVPLIAEPGRAGSSPVPPQWAPPLVLNASSEGPAPVAGHDYQFYVDATSGSLPVWDIRLGIELTPGLTLAGGPPPGCYPIPGGLGCSFPRLGGGQTISITVNVAVSPSLPTGAEAGVSAVCHYDWALWAYASVARQVVSPPPPTSPPPTTPPPTRPPPTSPPPHHTQPGPAPRKPTPAPSHSPAAHHPAAHHKPAPHPRPTPSVYHALEEKPLIPPVRPPPPTIPLGILLIAVLTPCVAVAATRFGKKTR